MNAVDAVQQQARRSPPLFDQVDADAGDHHAGFGPLRWAFGPLATSCRTASGIFTRLPPFT